MLSHVVDHHIPHSPEVFFRNRAVFGVTVRTVDVGDVRRVVSLLHQVPDPQSLWVAQVEARLRERLASVHF